ncbi:unnamed protein product, partial [Amoebophrya sp. A25]
KIIDNWENLRAENHRLTDYDFDELDALFTKLYLDLAGDKRSWQVELRNERRAFLKGWDEVTQREAEVLRELLTTVVGESEKRMAEVQERIQEYQDAVLVEADGVYDRGGGGPIGTRWKASEAAAESLVRAVVYEPAHVSFGLASCSSSMSSSGRVVTK